MALVFNGSNNTISGLAVGGLPDGVVDTDMIANNAVTSAKSTITSGISEADMWRLTSNLTGNQLPITTGNIERSDDPPYTKIGTGMSCSSGVFSFPSTGIWRVVWNATVKCSASTHQNVFTTEVTTNNGTSWDSTARTNTGVYKMSSGDSYGSASSSCLVDVTDTSTVKVRFEYIAGQGSEILMGDDNNGLTTWEFIKLAET